MKLVRDPRLYILSNKLSGDRITSGMILSPGNIPAFIVMEVELGDIRRVDFLIPEKATAEETLILIAEGLEKMKERKEGEDFDAS